MKRWFAIGIVVMIFGFLFYAIPTILSADEIAKKSDASVISVNPASKARIEFVADTWDFGSIPKGAIVSHEYKIRNIGEDTLVIGKVKPTCGCTTAPLSSNSIPPGGEANLTAIFNSEKFNGRVSKQIYIDSNDPIKPYLKVTFSAIINNPLLTITPEPAEANFGAVMSGSKAQLKLKVTNGEEKPVIIAVVEQAKAVKASIANPGIPAHGQGELILDLSAQGLQGEIKESITLEAVDIPNSRFTIPCKASITM